MFIEQSYQRNDHFIVITFV